MSGWSWPMLLPTPGPPAGEHSVAMIVIYDGKGMGKSGSLNRRGSARPE
jgi:hypothetical protein